MIACLQRCERAKVTVDKKVISEIAQGYLILLGVQKEDQSSNVKKLAQKIAQLRVFEDENQKMNLSIQDVSGQVIVVSQFTLAGSTKKGRRPSFDNAAVPDVAKKYYLEFVEELKTFNIEVFTGEFQAHMKVELINDGPVTFILEDQS